MMLYIDNIQELEWLAFALGDMKSKENLQLRLLQPI